MTSPLLDALVDRVAAARRAGGPAAPEAHPELSKLATELDGHWWKRVEEALTARARESPDRLQFSKEERLLIDAGVLDTRLLEGGAPVPDLLRELYAAAPPDQFYFSEWLERHYRNFMLYGRLDAAGSSGRHAAADPAAEELAKLRETRRKVYERMTPLLRNLPGFPPRAIELLVSGSLDDTIESLSAGMENHEDRRLAEQRKQLADIRDRLVRLARAKAGEEELALFDALAKVDRTIRERHLSRGAQPMRQVDSFERIKFVSGELKLVKSLLKLGVPGSGITRTHCTLLSSARRVTKADLAPVLEKVEECDPYLPSLPSILIAPYVGTGFYEWDRDTVFVPLRATRPVDEAIVTALANFRILLDALRSGGALKRAYEERFASKDFRGDFIRDYRNWVLGVGRGFKGALDAERYAFFMERLGPSAEHLYAPAGLVRLTPEERHQMVAECRGRVNRAEDSWLDHYRLAAAYHREARAAEAHSELSQAVKVNPVDGRLLCALAHLAAVHAAPARAKALHEEAIALCPNTIWHVISAEALLRL